MKTMALIVAGGKGTRLGGTVPKQFRNLRERPLLAWTIHRFEQAPSISEIVLVVPEEFLLFANENVVNRFPFKKVSKVVVGGASREESVRKGLASLSYATDFVAIHDGARPLVNVADIEKVVAIAQKERAAILARPVSDTVKRVEGDFILSTLDRAKLYLAETPQVFQYDLIMSAHKMAPPAQEATDDAHLVELLGFKVKTVVPHGLNFKITTENDLSIAGYLLQKSNEAGF